jgi:hypothetical protein
MSEYIEVDVRLDSHNLLQIETLINWRVKELKQLKKDNPGVPAMLCDEQLLNYKLLSAKISEARKNVKVVKEAADKAYFASQKKRQIRAIS